ncbi:MAG: tetratricopeptide repeat protein [Candidatus Omnitrophica bacterium]|nr:tetratricopeptide repeat protein [Candidatus Omnitrophota bacterium]
MKSKSMGRTISHSGPSRSGATRLLLDIHFCRKTIAWIALAGAAIYANALRCGFQFDDGYAIVENGFLRNIFDPAAIWSFDPPRFLTYLSFATNLFFTGLNVTAFHATNILIHIANSGLVFFLVMITAQTPRLHQTTTPEASRAIALLSALIFLCHPLQTQAVTYIVQRSASLATLFYLGTLTSYALARLMLSRPWYLAACVMCFAGMFAKQIMFTAPLTILLYDILFFDKHAEPDRKRWPRFVPFLVSLAVIPLLTVFGGLRGVQADGIPTVAGAIPHAQYLMTQSNVLVTYLRLLVLPVRQMLEYDYPVVKNLLEIRALLSLALLVALWVAAIRLRRRRPLIAFGILWFFVTVSVESGLIALPHVIFEHRMYLPMAGCAVAVSAAAWLMLRQKSRYLIFGVLVVSALSLLTVRRNETWKDKLTLWQDNVRKAPERGSVRYSLGLAYAELGQHGDAMREFQRALDLGYAHGRVYFSRARVWEALQKKDAAIRDYETGLGLDPEFVPALNNLGTLWAEQKRFDRALLMYQRASELAPANPQILANLGTTYAQMGRNEQAALILELALRIDPSFSPARANLQKIRALTQKTEDPNPVPPQ